MYFIYQISIRKLLIKMTKYSKSQTPFYCNGNTLPFLTPLPAFLSLLIQCLISFYRVAQKNVCTLYMILIRKECIHFFGPLCINFTVHGTQCDS